ncbi:hypothetical protein Aduo_012674 [Ancylostoma duodenale]
MLLFSLLAITGQVADADIADWQNILIDCIPLQGESHSAAVLEKKFRESIDQLGIPLERINLFVADEASVMKVMGSNLDLRYEIALQKATKRSRPPDSSTCNGLPDEMGLYLYHGLRCSESIASFGKPPSEAEDDCI